MLMTGSSLKAVSSVFEKKQVCKQACDWRWKITYDEKGTIIVENPLQQKVTLETSHRSLTEAYAEHLHTTLDNEMDAGKLCALAIEHGLKTPCTSVSGLRNLLKRCFSEKEHVEIEMNKFFAEPSDEGIENVT